jgi:hypothetical protein
VASFGVLRGFDSFTPIFCRPPMVNNDMCNRVFLFRTAPLFLGLAFVAACCRLAVGQAYINEIYFDPPSSPDYPLEYIELRGTPGASLADTYLIFLENEDNLHHTGSTGQVEMIFDLGHAMSGGAASFGTNGYLTLRDKNSPFSVAPGTTDLVNTGSGNGFGSGPGSSTIGAINEGNTGLIENSGFTAMLIHNDSGAAPTLGLALDGLVDNDGNPSTLHDGLDYATGQPGWTILDSIGVYSDPVSQPDVPGEDVFGRTYASINYGPDLDGTEVTYLDDEGVEQTITFHPNLSPGQTYVGLGYESEYVARWGDSTGSDAGDWHVSNLTNNPMSGFISNADGLRQSGNIHDPPIGTDDFVQTNQFVPYGANLTNTLGAANYPLNLTQLPWDYNHDGVVDAADYTVWRDTLGSTTDLRADGNGSGKIEAEDFDFWRGRYGYTVGGAGAGGVSSVSVPEPATVVLAFAGMIAIAATRRRGFRR